MVERERSADRCKSLACLRQVYGVEVEPEEAPVVSHSLEQFDGVSRPTRGTVDDDGAGQWFQGSQDFVEKHRPMFAGGCAPSSPKHGRFHQSRSSNWLV